MRKVFGMLALGATTALLGCTRSEPVGIDALLAASSKQVVVSPSQAT